MPRSLAVCSPVGDTIPKFTPSQLQRFREYGEDDHSSQEFDTVEEREETFSAIISDLKNSNDSRIREMITDPGRHSLAILESRLSDLLTSMGFIEVKTPLIISKASLEKMTITKDSSLYRQVFMIDEKRCLRPMLAPNLYFVMRKLRDRTKGPVRIFEIGSCFRKESKSTNHLEEFTMLNFVELGPESDAMDLLKGYISRIMDEIGLEYELVTEGSEVYRSTVDVEVNGRELASGAIGPHVLDEAHDIHEAWCGAGFGLERVLMEKTGKDNIKKSAKSLVYLNGAKID